MTSVYGDGGFVRLPAYAVRDNDNGTVSDAQPDTLWPTPPDRTIAYGPDPDQVIDIRMARNPRRDVTVVIIHGGFWRPATDRSDATVQSAALADSGYDVATIEYRRIPGDWPAMAADILAAIRTVSADPDLPKRTVVVGHSAGGHLAVWAAHQDGLDVEGVVSLAGAADLHLARDLGLGDGAADALMGSASTDDWRAADPAMLGTPAVPVRVVHGTADDVVPIEVSRSYLAKTDNQIPVHALDGVGHSDLIDPSSPAFPHTIAAIEDLAPATRR